MHRPSQMPHVIVVLGLLAALLLPAAAPTQAAIQAPVLKWAYGGCFDSYCETGWYASPAVANLDGDATPEVIWGAYDLVSLTGPTGVLEWRAESGQRIWPSIVVADLTNDGSLEVVVGRGGDQVSAYAFDGSLLWTRNPFGNGEVRTLAVSDLDGDDQQEVIVGRASGGSTRQLNVFQADGSVRSGWPARRDNEAGYGWGMYNENVVVADFDGDGYREIIGPTDTHYITALDRAGNQLPVNSIYGAGKVWSQVGVHVDQAADLRGYANCGSEHRPNFANSAPVASDLDKNGVLEIIVVGDVYNCDLGDPDGDMYHMPWILNLDRTRWSDASADWTTIPPDPGTRPLSQDFSVIQNSVTNAVVADLDGDGRNEILFPSYDGRLHAYWLDKTPHGSWPFDVPGSGIRFASEPAVADLDNDGQAEVILTSWPENGGDRLGQLHILNSSGVQIVAVDLPAPRGDDWNGGLGAPTIANIDSDADLEVVIGTVSSGVVAYDLPGSSNAKVLWGTGRGNYRRTGVAALEEGFGLRLSTYGVALAPLGTTNLTITLTGGEQGSSSAINLGVSAAPSDLDVSLADTSVTPPGSTTLTITDTGPNQQLPGRAYTVTITASDGSRSLSQQVSVVVGGSRAVLPWVVRP